MPVKLRNAIVLSLLVLIAVLTALTAFLDRRSRDTRRAPDTSEKSAGNPDLRPVPNEDNFTKYEYALPRADKND